MKLNPKMLRVAGYVLVLAPIALEVLGKVVSGQPVNWYTVLMAVSAALGGTQAAKRAGDLAPEQVDAKVSEALASVRPSADHFMPPPSEDGGR